MGLVHDIEKKKIEIRLAFKVFKLKGYQKYQQNAIFAEKDRSFVFFAFF